MHPNMLKAMKAKKKRAVDPNAPPRPNLLSHEKTIKGMSVTAQSQQAQIEMLKNKVLDLERKMRNQASYIDAVHSQIRKK
jgi:hypothetical protein